MQAADFTVLNTSASGAGSFPQAVLDANAGVGTDSIIFTFPEVTTISITGNQAITRAYTINGSNNTDNKVTLSSVANTLDIAAGITITINCDTGRSFNISMGITGVAGTGITKTGAGTLFLNNASGSFAGDTTLAGVNGLTEAGNNTAFGTGKITMEDNTSIKLLASIAIANNLRLEGIGAFLVDGTGTLSGNTDNTTGSLRKMANGTLVLSGTNLHTGGTFVSGGGQITISNNKALGAGDLTINDSSTLGITDGIVAGNNITIQDGQSGTFEVGTGATGALSGAIGATTGSVQKVGSGTLVLTGANLHTGGTTLTEGKITASNNAALGDASGALTMADTTVLEMSSGVTIANGVTIAAGGTGTFYLNAVTGTLTGVIGATTGSVQKVGSGTLVLTGANLHTGGTTLTEGKITAGNDAALGTNTLTMADTTKLEITNGITVSNEVIISTGATGFITVDTGETGTFSGATTATNGILRKTQSGTLVLSGSNLHTGGTILSTGQITAANNAALGTGALTMSNTRILGISNGIAVANGVTITDGESGVFNVDTAEIGTLSGIIATTTGSIEKTGAGSLVLSGGNLYSGGTTLTTGQITAGNNAALGTNTLTMADTTILGISNGIAVANGVTITAGESGVFTVVSGETGTFSGVIATTTGGIEKTGAGTLSLSGANLYSGGTTLTTGQITAGNNAALGTNTLTMADTTILGISNGIAVANGVTITGGESGVFTVVSGETGTFSGVIATTTGSIEKTGAGALSLSGANLYSGGTTLTTGQITVNDSGALGTGPLLIGNGATLAIGSGLTVANNVSGSGSGTGTIDVTTGTATMSGNTGATTQSFQKTGTGTLVLSGANSSTGGYVLTTGQITLNSTTGLGASSGSLSMGGSTTLLMADTIAAANPVAIATGTGTVEVATTDGATLSGIISGAGSLGKSGTGTLVLSGVNEYTGGTDFTAGQITVSNNAALGTNALTMADTTILGISNGIAVANGVTITAGESGVFTVVSGETGTFSGVIATTTGSIEKTGAGSLVLSGGNLYSGGTTLTTGQITAGNNAALGTNTLTMADTTILGISNGIAVANGVTITGGESGVFTVVSGETGTFSGVIATTTGSIEKTGAGALSLSGANLYSGGTTLTTGQITVNDSGALGTGPLLIGNGATLAIGSGLTVANNVSGSGSGTGTIDVTTGTATMSGNTGATTQSFQKTGTGTLVLSGANSSTGGYVLTTGQITLNSTTGLGASSGSLSMGGSTTLLMADTIAAANPVAIATGTGTVEVATTDGATLSGIISGAGSLGKSGTGTLVLSGVNEYTGGTDFTAGQITVSNNEALGTQAVSMADGTTLLLSDGINVANQIAPIATGIIEVATGDSATLSGLVIGAGILNKTEAGTLTLSGTNTYSGGTTLSAGQITAGHNTSLGSGTLTMVDTTVLVVSDGVTAANPMSLTGNCLVDVNLLAETATLTGNISGTGFLRKTGAGHLVLSGTNSQVLATVLNAGTITVSSNTALGDVTGPFTMADATTLVISDGVTVGNHISPFVAASPILNVASGTGALSGILELTSGTYSKTGAGELVLSGTNLYTGIFGVNAGTCTVNGSLAGGATVASGATLKGTGTISGAVTVDTGGELTPGNSIGTINVASLTLNAGSTTNIEFSPLATSLIDVTGAAALAGTLNLTQNAGSYGASGSYEILTSTGRTGTFDTIAGGLSGFTFSLTYDDDNVQLLYIYTAPPVSSSISTDGLWGNVLKFADYLNADAPASSEYEALAALTGDAIFDGVNRASSARNAFGTYTSQQTVLSLSNILSNYLGSKRFFQEYSVSKGVAGKNLPYESELFAANTDKKNQFDYKREEKKSSMWGSAFVDFSYQDQESQNVAFNFISEGALLGYDYQMDGEHGIGGVISYAHSQIDDKGAMGRSDISYYVAALYANYMKKNFYVEGAFWGVFNQIYSARKIAYGTVNAKATANQNGWQINPHIELGYSAKRYLVEFEPYVAVDYVMNWQGSFTETGAGNLNMHQKAQTSAMLQSQVGLRCYQEIETEKARIGFKEGAGFINRTPFGTGTVTTSIFGTSSFVTLESFTDSQCLGSVEALCFAEIGKKRDSTISLGYQGQFGVQYISNELVLRLSKAF